MADRDVDYLLVGGGRAAANCARWLRRSGADGSILLVGREPDLPYDRPPLSKEYLRGEQSREDALLQDAAWYEEQSIEVLTRTSAMKLDLAARTARLSTRQDVGFGQLLLATGANVRRLNVPGAELQGIHYLRTFGNTDAIRADAPGKRVVMIGGSYIGSEVAASLTTMGSRCTIVMQEPVVLCRPFGTDAARFFEDRLREHDIAIHPSDELERFEGADGRVTTVVLKSGAELPADAVVIGVGVNPDVMLARSAGLELGQTGGVIVDRHLQTATPGVYAAGDIAEYDSVVHGRRLRVEHTDVAFTQGKTAALNMVGRATDYDVVPYFYADLADWASLESVGPAHTWDREVVRGAFDDGAFTVFYLQEGRLAGALSVGRGDDLMSARRFIAEHTELAGREAALADLSTDLETIS